MIPMKTLTRGQLAKASKVGAEAIRYYEREGLLPPTPRSRNGYRYYAEETLHRLNFIRRAKNLGFSLKETRDLLSLHDNPNASRASVKTLSEGKLIEIEQKISDLRRIRDVLGRLATECSGKGPISGCPIIQALANDNYKRSIDLDQK